MMNTHGQFGMRNEHWDALLKGLVRTEYHLLLGAGASLDSRDRSGKALPSAGGLVSELVEVAGLPDDARRMGLPRAYEAAKRRTRSTGTLTDFLVGRFTMCVPATWYRGVVQLSWAQIWNLNIDDVVEQAYEKWPSPQSIRSLNWTDRFSTTRAVSDVAVVHLHGQADRETTAIERNTENLVFDIAAYLRAVTQPHAWHHIFGDSFAEQPFIIVGASLASEFDLAAILRSGNASLEATGRPSVIVLPRMSTLEQEEFASWGLLPVVATGEEFFRAVVDDLPRYQRDFAATEGLPRGRVSHAAIRFLQQFGSIRLDEATRAPAAHDFLAGHDPTWADVLRGIPAEFEIVQRVVGDITRQEGTSIRVWSIMGRPFTGKSTALLMILRTLIRRGRDAYLFRNLDRLDVDATLEWLQHSPSTVLAFDGLADPAHQVQELCERCEALGVSLIAVGVERSSRQQRIEAAIDPAFLADPDDLLMGKLSNRDIRSLLARLRSAKRLGQLTSKPDGAQFDYFRNDSGRDLFRGMAGLELGRGFIDRYSEEAQSLRDARHRTVVYAACIAYSFGYGIPLGIAATHSGVDTRDLVPLLRPGGPLVNLLELQQGLIKPVHRFVASRIVGKALRNDSDLNAFDVTVSLAESLAPHLTPANIRAQTLPYRIARELMDHEVIAAWISRGRTEEWYRKLQRLLEWNARYWEQRALAAASRREFDSAESYAAQAVAVRDDAFTRNTLASILMRKALEWTRVGSAASLDLYRRGVESLNKSRAVARVEFEHPYVTYFSYTLALIREGGLDAQDASVQQEWRRWYEDASQARPFQHGSLYRQLQDFNYDWMKLRVTPAGGAIPQK